MSELKAGWNRYRFSEMVMSMGATRKARGWTASDSGVDRYVGLEHLDSNSLKIRRWGSPDDVGANSDLRHFEPGDVILARRGIELRKVGMAEFRGVASGHALVFRAKPEIVLPTYLAFFIQSDAFMTRADRFSRGSLSHTVNLSALMDQEFALPPLDEQRRLGRMFAATRALHDAIQNAQRAAEATRRSLLFSFFRPLRRATDHFPNHWKLHRVGDAGDTQVGIRKHPGSLDGPNMRPYLRVANVLDGWIDWTDVMEINVPPVDLERCALRDGDILINKGNSMNLVGRPAIFRPQNHGNCYFQDHLMRFRPHEGIHAGFAQAYFQHLLYTLQFTRIAVASTSIATIPSDSFESLPFPVPPLDEQLMIAERVEGTVRATAQCESRSRELRALERTLSVGATDRGLDELH